MTPDQTPPSRADVVVVGGGLAGLNAARELVRAGIDVVLLEGAETIGGRVSTDVVNDRLLDRGFQLYNPAYPEAARVLDPERLDLRPFGRGVRILRRSGTATIVDPRHRAGKVIGLRGIPGGLAGGIRFAAYAGGCAYMDIERIKARPHESINEVLTDRVRSRPMMEAMLRPFLAGVFGDWDLATDRRYADLVLRSFVRGTPSLPAEGMNAIPRSLAEDVGRGRIHCRVPVRSVTATQVRHDGGTTTARRVIVATDAISAAALVPAVPLPTFNALTTWYFLARPGDLGADDDLLMVDGDRRGILVNVAAVSSVAPAYARSNELLIAATAVGRHASDDDARRHLGLMLGAGVRRWPLLARYEIPQALPAAPVPMQLRGRQDFGGVLVAGDHRDTPSIQGALVSGKRAARRILREFGVAPSA